MQDGDLEQDLSVTTTIQCVSAVPLTQGNVELYIVMCRGLSTQNLIINPIDPLQNCDTLLIYTNLHTRLHNFGSISKISEA